MLVTGTASNNTEGYKVKPNTSLSPAPLSALYKTTYVHLKKNAQASLTHVAQWVGHCPTNERSLVRFLVRTHAWAVGRVLGWGREREREATDRCFSPSRPLFLKIKKNKIFKKLFPRKYASMTSYRTHWCFNEPIFI